MAVLFATKKCKVVIWDIRQNLIDETLKEIKDAGFSGTGYVCDVSKKEMVYERAKQVNDEIGSVDILVNNAGISGLGKPLLELEDESIIRTFQVNVFGVIWLTKAFLPAMIKRNTGHIVTIDSIMGVSGAAGLTDYCASKFAIFGFHESLRLEINKLKANINTTIVCPYAIDTGMFSGLKNWLFPILKVQDVADTVVDGVIHNRKLIMIPRYFQVLGNLMRLCPVSFSDYTLQLLGVLDSMDSFKGRGKEWLLYSLDNKSKKN